MKKKLYILTNLFLTYFFIYHVNYIKIKVNNIATKYLEINMSQHNVTMCPIFWAPHCSLGTWYMPSLNWACNFWRPDVVTVKALYNGYQPVNKFVIILMLMITEKYYLDQWKNIKDSKSLTSTHLIDYTGFHKYWYICELRKREWLSVTLFPDIYRYVIYLQRDTFSNFLTCSINKQCFLTARIINKNLK